MRKLVTAQGHRSHPDSCFVLPSYVVVFLATLVLRSFASVQWVFGENYSLGVSKGMSAYLIKKEIT